MPIYFPNQYPDLLYKMKYAVNPGIAQDSFLSDRNQTFEIKRVERGKLNIQEADCDVRGYKCLRLTMSTVEELPRQTTEDLLYPESTNLHDVITRLQGELKPLTQMHDYCSIGKLPEELPEEGLDWLFLFC